MFLFIDYPSFLSVFLAILGAVSLMAAAIVIVMAKQREEIHKTDTAHVTSLAGLLATRDLELRVAREEIATLSSEYRQIAQIDIKEVVNSWERHKAADCFRENAVLRTRINELVARLEPYEKV